jgi:hypothetical protein
MSGVGDMALPESKFDCEIYRDGIVCRESITYQTSIILLDAQITSATSSAS